MLQVTGADGLLIGRAAQGRPWIFREVEHYLRTGELLAAPTLGEVESTLLEHVQALHEFYGEVMGVRIARKHVGWYLATLPGARTSAPVSIIWKTGMRKAPASGNSFAEQRSGPGSVDGTEVAA